MNAHIPSWLRSLCPRAPRHCTLHFYLILPIDCYFPKSKDTELFCWDRHILCIQVLNEETQSQTLTIILMSDWLSMTIRSPGYLEVNYFFPSVEEQIFIFSLILEHKKPRIAKLFLYNKRTATCISITYLNIIIKIACIGTNTDTLINGVELNTQT